MTSTPTFLPPKSLQIDGTASALNDDLIAATEVLGFGSVSLQISGTWVGTLSFQISNDGTIWDTVTLNNVSGTSTTTTVATTTTNGTFFFSPVGRYFRVRMTAYTSGTASARAIASYQGPRG